VITAQELHTALRYFPETGEFRVNDKHVATRPRCDLPDAGERYRWIRLKGKTYAAHRLAWLYMTGEWPNPMPDHKNRDGLDNRWDNLRQATSAQNNQNRGLASNNTSGRKGVSWSKSHGQWQAQIKIDGRKKHLGYSSSRDGAHALYVATAIAAWGEFACEG